MPADLAELEALARSIGRTLKVAMPEGVGFALLVFDYGEGGHLTYVSSARREDMVKAVKEWLELVEAEPPGARS